MRPRSCFFAIATFLSLVLAALPGILTPAMAETKESDIPKSLEPWKSWVLHGSERLLCPPVYNDPGRHACVYPARLSVNAEASGGSFGGEWRVIGPDAAVALPYAPGLKPTRVKVNGKEHPLMQRGEIPTVLLGPGRHAVEGRFVWDQPPQYLSLPPNVGVLEFKRDGALVEFPDFSPDGQLRLADRVETIKTEDRVEVTVFRLLEDALPLRVVTHIRLGVSGSPRRVALPEMLLPGTTPLDVKSSAAVSFGPEGTVFAKVGPGRFDIDITARQNERKDVLGPVPGRYGREIWAFAAAPELRVAELRGAPALDPQTTDLPAAWKRYPAFLVEPGSRLELAELHRGEPGPLQDALTLERTLWLDFSGQGLSIKDHISGKMRRSRTLAMRGPIELGRVVMEGKDQPIVLIGDARLPGVETRASLADLQAESRLNAFQGKVSVSGWDHDFRKVSAQVNLPPGWRVFSVFGADAAHDSWCSQWNLLDIFLTLILALAGLRIRGRLAGLTLLVFAVLSYHEADSPAGALLFLVLSLGLLRLLADTQSLAGWSRSRRFATLLYGASLGLAVLLAIPFVVGQARTGLHPQLETSGAWKTPSFDAFTAAPRMATETTGRARPAAPPSAKAAPEPGRALQAMEDSVKSPGAGLYLPRQMLMVDPEALVQTGPGMPNWHWRQVSLEWNGPVERSQELRLVLLSPAVNLWLSLARIALLAVSLFLLIDPKRLLTRGSVSAGGLAATAGGFVVLVCLALHPGAAMADAFPPEKMLDALKQRLLEPAACFPDCASVSALEVRLGTKGLELLLSAHAATEAVLPLPSVSDRWQPRSVSLDEAPAKDLYRENGRLWLLVPQGAHRVLLSGPAPESVSFTVALPLKPWRAVVAAPGWRVRGLGANGQVEGSLQFSREDVAASPGSSDAAAKPEEEKSAESSNIPFFLQVERRLTLGLNWEATTTVKRLTPATEPVVVEIPLLPGEFVLTKGIDARGDKVLLNLDPRTAEARWNSRLDIVPEIRLTAPEASAWVETWIIEAASIWDLGISGPPMVKSVDDSGHWRPQWRPWPGETVRVAVTRPAAAPGEFMTIDAIEHVFTPGERLGENTLRLSVRASKGGRHSLFLPPRADITALTVGGRDVAWSGGKPGEVGFALAPGKQDVDLRWRQEVNATVGLGGLIQRGPGIDVGRAAVNVTRTLAMPADRWIVCVWGDTTLGPAVKYWSYFAAILLAAFALARVPGVPLTGRQWALLGLGLTQVEPLTAAAACAWLLALALRRKTAPKEGWFVFDCMQLGLVVLVCIGLGCLYAAIQQGLLGLPEMQIAGNGSTALRLNWFSDRVAGPLPEYGVFSVPLWVYRAVMLAWSLWMAQALLRWLRWGFESLGVEGWWRKPVLRWRRKQEAAAQEPARE